MVVVRLPIWIFNSFLSVITFLHVMVFQVTKRMGKKKLKSRSKIKTFVKVANFNHLMPTRYALLQIIIYLVLDVAYSWESLYSSKVFVLASVCKSRVFVKMFV